MIEKKELRKKHITLRNELSKEEQLSASHEIMESVVSSYDFMQAKTILIYASYGSEVMTKGIMEYAFLLKKKVCCPKVTAEGEMEFYEIHSYKELEEGYKGIPEPPALCEKLFIPSETEKILILLPGVCFDRHGHRIGYGKGFYDRFLDRVSKKDVNIVRMALAYDNQVEEEIPFEETDALYDLLVTEIETVCLMEEEEE